MATFDQERDNMVRWDRRRRPFYEEYFIKLHFADSPQSLWLRYTLMAPRKGLGTPSAGIWAMLFNHEEPEKHVAVKEIVSIDLAVIDKDIFYYQIKDSSIYNSGARGQVSSGGHELKWDLQYIPNQESFKLYPYSFYYFGFPRMKLVIPNWSVQAQGEITLDGNSHSFYGSPGCQGHLWGTQRVEGWAWAHCNSFVEDTGAVLEVLTAQFRLGKKTLPPVTLFCLRLGDGREIKFNRMVHWLLNKSKYDLGSWEVSGARGHWKVQVQVDNSTPATMGITDNDTDGTKLYRYHSEMAEITVEIFELKGTRYRKIKTLTCRDSGTFEVGTRTPFSDFPLML